MLKVCKDHVHLDMAITGPFGMTRWKNIYSKLTYDDRGVTMYSSTSFGRRRSIQTRAFVSWDNIFSVLADQIGNADAEEIQSKIDKLDPAISKMFLERAWTLLKDIVAIRFKNWLRQ